MFKDAQLSLYNERDSFATLLNVYILYIHILTHHESQEIQTGVQKGNFSGDLVNTGSVLRCSLGR